MNELILFLQLLLIITFALLATRWGKEALCALVVVQVLLANLFVLKQIDLFSFHVTSSDAFAIGSMIALNLLQEYYGKESAKKAIKLSFAFMVFFAMVSQVHLFYQPSVLDTAHPAYAQLLAPAPRLLLASLLTFFIVQQFDTRLFSTLKEKFTKVPFWSRNFLSIALSQLLDTALFTLLGLYGLIGSLFDIFIVSFALKCLIALSLTPIATLSKKFIKA